MLYQISNGVVSYGGDTILEEINFEIKGTEKIAVVGRNGCGKTTLLKLIAGEVELDKRDSDEDIFIATSGKPTIGYLKQIAFEDDSVTLETEILKAFAQIQGVEASLEEMTHLMDSDHSEALIARYTALNDTYERMGGYTWRKEYETVVRKFGFSEDDKHKKLSEFSGGQRTKIAFAKMLLSKPDILLLDEPTNHLDMDTVTWLEGYLRDYNKAVVIVSHDRMFLDRIVTVVYEIEYGITSRYAGNYASFIEQKKVNYEKQRRDYALQQKEIKRLEALIERFKSKPTKTAMARSKLRYLERMDKIDPPSRYDLTSFHANFTPDRESFKEVVRTTALEVGYDSVVARIDFLLEKGHRTGIIGDNGTGKSTFLKTIMGMIPALSGSYKIGGNVDIGYCDQQMAQYQSDESVIDDFRNEFPSLTEQDARSSLAAFMFTGEDVFKSVAMLSGGEKVRLALCKIFKRKPNLLILDEPTNHMDIVGKETLEAMLKSYKGTVLFVSHDRYFIREIAQSLLIFDNGKVSYYPYDYEEYCLEKAEEAKARDAAESSGAVTGKNSGASPRVDRSYNNPGKELSKIRRRKEKLEAQIAEFDEKIASFKKEYEDPEIQSDYEKLGRLDEEIAKLEGEQEELLMQLMELEE